MSHAIASNNLVYLFVRSTVKEFMDMARDSFMPYGYPKDLLAKYAFFSTNYLCSPFLFNHTCVSQVCVSSCVMHACVWMHARVAMHILYISAKSTRMHTRRHTDHAQRLSPQARAHTLARVLLACK